MIILWKRTYKLAYYPKPNYKMMKEVSVQELREKMNANDDFQLIDVRETFEYEIGNLNGLNIPLAHVMLEAGSISKNKQVIIHCRSGARSAAVIMQLERELDLKNLYNLKGGILAWKAEIDESINV